MDNVVNLTREEYEKIKKQKLVLGSGVDGTVYGIDFKTVYKFYHNTSDSILILGRGVYDSNGVNIRNCREIIKYGQRINNKPVNYIDSDDVKLGRESAIEKAIEKQKYIKHTNLPQKMIKVENKLVGCVYKRYKSIFGIYAASMLPINTRKKILRNLFSKLQELYDNYIYPVTLAQKNDILPFIRKDANALLSYNLDPFLIDLDGISTIYYDKFNKYDYERSLSSFSKMALEILTGMDINYIENELELEMTIKEIVERGIPEEVILDFYNNFGFNDEESVLKLLK